jgi:pimeloyl-ACP methyl ester carboxylesterase
MPNNVVLIHGWSATSASMANVSTFLRGQGFAVTDLWLGDYISLDDDVRVEDVAKRMDVVLQQAVAAGEVHRPFDMIVHSTGGLVSREWLVRYGPGWASGCPLKRLLMLAPANFGSRLAAQGKSMIGRIVKGWNNWFQTGEQMLRELELASSYQWGLARRDLISETPGQPSPYGPGKVLPFVICGSRGYTDGLSKIANESGSDGTVRPAAANLNVLGMTLDFATDPDNPVVTPWSPRQGAEQLAFVVLPDRNHASILDPADLVGSASGAQLGRLVVEALTCADADYAALCGRWDAVCEATATLNPSAPGVFQKDTPAPENLHQYMQVITRVVDDDGQSVDDYFLEFFSPQVPGEEDSVDFHRQVLKDVQVNSIDNSARCLFVDRTGLFTVFYVGKRTQVAMSMSAAKLGPNIRYFDKTKDGAKGHVLVHDRDEVRRKDLAARLQRNRTHLVEIRIPRQPIDKVFRLSPSR